jgi:hypothetical protein
MRFQTLFLTASIVIAPAAFTASFAQSSGGGSDIPKATTSSAFPGPRITNSGKVVTSSTRPNSGIGGGGMSTGGGIKAGGEDRKSKIPDSAP